MTPAYNLIPEIFELWINSPFITGGTFIILILSDYFLTRRGFLLAQKRYRNHFKSEIYELNPSVQNTIHEEKPLDKKIWIGWTITIGIIVGLSMIYQQNQDTFLVEFIFEIILGFFFWTYFLVNMSHIKSILIFWYVNNKPGILEGAITTSPSFNYKTSAQQIFILGWLGAITFFLTGQPFFLGLFLQSIVNSRSMYKWEEETRDGSSVREEKSENK
ncbi:MAG: hypothetical protein ACXABU_12610 [Candidatus Hodarchaeales archaeon]|jgi:hypothetical protein